MIVISVIASEFQIQQYIYHIFFMIETLNKV